MTSPISIDNILFFCWILIIIITTKKQQPITIAQRSNAII